MRRQKLKVEAGKSLGQGKEGGRFEGVGDIINAAVVCRAQARVSGIRRHARNAGRGGRERDRKRARRRRGQKAQQQPASQPASRETHPGQNRTGSLTQTADGRPLAGHSLDSHTQTPRLTPQLSIRVTGFARADSCVARAPSHGSWALARPLLPLRSCRPPELPVPRLSHR